MPKSFNPCTQCETQSHCERRGCVYIQPNSTMNQIKPTHQAAYDFAMATLKQSAGEIMLDKALRTLGSDNQIIDLCEPILVAYRKLLSQNLGQELMDWLDWWMYETDYGSKAMIFSINNTKYDPTTMTLYRFLEIVDANA